MDHHEQDTEGQKKLDRQRFDGIVIVAHAACRLMLWLRSGCIMDIQEPHLAISSDAEEGPDIQEKRPLWPGSAAASLRQQESESTGARVHPAFDSRQCRYSSWNGTVLCGDKVGLDQCVVLGET